MNNGRLLGTGMSGIGTLSPFAALRRSRPVTGLLLPCQRGVRHASSWPTAVLAGVHRLRCSNRGTSDTL